MLRNTEISYGLISRIFHWLIGILIITMLIVGFIMIGMEPTEERWEIYDFHKATGLFVLFLVFLRLLWMISNIKVLLPTGILPEWQKRAAALNHKFLYFLMFIMLISGVLMFIVGGHDVSFFGVFAIKAFAHNKAMAKIFWNIHYYTSFILIATIALHPLVALYHHFIRKDKILLRMIKSI